MQAIDILLPTYNRRDCLAKAIACIRAQTFRDWRLIVVNDGGESVADVIDACRDERIECHDRPHLGKAAQLNFALERVQAKYVAYMDDDDEVFPCHLEKLYRAAEAVKADLVYSDTFFTVLQPDGRIFRQKVENEKDVTYADLRYRNRINHKQILHTKALADVVGRYDEELRIFIDFDYIKRLMKVAERPFHVREITGNHVLRKDPKTGSYMSISGLWKSDPEAVGRSLLRFFSKDPTALRTAYRVLLDDDRRLKALRERFGGGVLSALRRLFRPLPPVAPERIRDALPVDGAWKDADGGLDLESFFRLADETNPAIALVNGLAVGAEGVSSASICDPRALPPSSPCLRFQAIRSGNGLRFSSAAGLPMRWVMLTSARPLPNEFSLEFTYVPHTVFEEQLQLDFQMKSFGNRLRFMVRGNERLEFGIVENGRFLRKPVRSVPFSFKMDEPASIRLWSRAGVHSLAVNGRCLMSFTCDPGVSREGGYVALVFYAAESESPIDVEVRDFRCGLSA